ncbi:MAG: acyl-CoA dehydratase activase [Bacteroidota bacterium]
MGYFLGVDIGSTTIKIVLVDETGKMVDKIASPTGSMFNKNALESLGRLLDSNNLTKDDVKYIVSTGYGRKLFKISNENVNELTANAEGARNSLGDDLKVKTIINVGGQDTKVILLNEEGKMTNFFMNDKCAAGTGRFLDISARNLEVEVQELEVLHFKAKDTPLPINSICAVFAESEIISLLASGHHSSEIASGIHYSIAKRISRLANRGRIEDTVLFDGGTALNKGMVDALENELMRPVLVNSFPQFTTSYGAALIAKVRYLDYQ